MALGMAMSVAWSVQQQQQRKTMNPTDFDDPLIFPLSVKK